MATNAGVCVEASGQRKLAPTIKGLLGLLILVWGTLGMGIPGGFSQNLSFNAQQGEVGDTVTFTIRVDGAPNTVEAFGFDVLYDRDVLQYTGSFIPGEMVNRFGFFNVNEANPGRTRVAGFSISDRVAAGRSGAIVTLEFTVIKPGNATLSLVNLVDDVAGWTTQAGLFEGLSAQSPADESEKGASQPPSEAPAEVAAQPSAEPPQDAASPLSTEPSGGVTPRSPLSQGGDTAAFSRRAQSQSEDPPRALPTTAIIAKPTEGRQAEKETSSLSPATPPVAATGSVGHSPAPRVGSPSPSAPSPRSERATEATSETREAAPHGAPDTAPPATVETRQQTSLGVSETVRGKVTLPHDATSGQKVATVVGRQKTSMTTDPEQTASQAGGFLSQGTRTLVFMGVAIVLGVVAVILASIKKLA